MLYSEIKNIYIQEYQKLYPDKTSNIKTRLTASWVKFFRGDVKDIIFHKKVLTAIEALNSNYELTDSEKCLIFVEDLIQINALAIKLNLNQPKLSIPAGNFIEKTLCKFFDLKEKDYCSYRSELDYPTIDYSLLQTKFEKELSLYKDRNQEIINKRLSKLSSDDPYVNCIKSLEKQQTNLTLPQWALCPLSNHLMINPVLLIGDGNSYEETWLKEYLSRKHVSPITGKKLYEQELIFIANNNLKKAIQGYCKKIVEDNNLVDNTVLKL